MTKNNDIFIAETENTHVRVESRVQLIEKFPHSALRNAKT